MGKFKDLTGQRFCRLLVTGRAPNNKHGMAVWHCICDCGTKLQVIGHSLRVSRTKSCGCYKKDTPNRQTIDLIGQSFGSLKILAKDLKINDTDRWIALCTICNNKKHGLYGYFLRKGITVDCGCLKGSKISKAKTFYSELKIEKIAKKFKYRSDFCNHEQSAYNAARKLGILDKVCKHMKVKGNLYKRAIYAFEHPDKSVYVGLTYDYDQRYKEHMSKNKILIKKAKLGNQVFKKFNTWYSIDIVGQKEAELIEKYQKKGWTILNKSEAGSLGYGVLIWDQLACFKEAKKYKTRTEWVRKSSGSYSAARKRGWMEECCAHMSPAKTHKKKVQCIETGEVLKSIMQWANAFGENCGANLGAHLKGRRQHYKNYTFKYV